MIDVQINLASPVLTTSASFMKTLKIKFQNLGKDSEVGRGSGKFHPCCSLQIICDTPQCNYSDFCVTMGHLCKYSDVAAFAKKQIQHSGCVRFVSLACVKNYNQKYVKKYLFLVGWIGSFLATSSPKQSSAVPSHHYVDREGNHVYHWVWTLTNTLKTIL